MYGNPSFNGTNKPELKQINRKNIKLIIIFIKPTLQDKPIRKPMFDIKMIIGIIYIIINKISNKNKFALLNDNVIANEKIS